jgi:hypothetical protein
VREWGRIAADTLMRVIAGETVTDVDLPPAALVVRGSTAPPPHVTATTAP